MPTITTVKIFPAIGIARLGNSPDQFFIGSELPGVRTPPADGYKDTHCRVKRQAARFRLFGYDAGGALVQEITQADAGISWTVHLANKKAAWKRFNGLADNASLRNPGVADRSTLEIDPGARTLNGPNQSAGFNTGLFLGTPVALGEMRTDADGRLLVLGGFGNSASVPAGIAMHEYANNDGWHDDASDGPVTASVILNGTAVAITAVPAWVNCVPPDFAPPVDNITTLYDTLFDVAVTKGWLAIPAMPSFNSDIFPILNRVQRLAGASGLAGSAHFSFVAALPPAAQPARAAIFNRLRDPNNPVGAPGANMPRLFDDNNQKFHTITKTQYSVMQKWKDGNFVDDWTGSAPPPASTITPDGLTRAALEACVGAAFFPGIEASWFLRSSRPSEYNYVEPFRLDHSGRGAGDVTKQMAVPWQADFYECNVDSGQGLAWWPAQRPDEVTPEGGGASAKWIRDIVRQDGSPGVTLEDSHLDMVQHWHKLGFVVEKGGGFEESERHVVCKIIFLVTDRSDFSEDEVAGALLGATPAGFDNALYVIAEGFLPSELGITASHPTVAQLAGLAPAIAIRRADGSVVPGMQAIATELLLEDDSLPPMLRQRCTYAYRIEFSSVDAFFVDGVDVETQDVSVSASKLTFGATAVLTLFHQPNPYMLDGPTAWLSTDVRVFQLIEGDTRFGIGIGADAAAATAFIGNVISSFNAHGAVAHPFDTILTDEDASRLELSEKVAGKRVFNFAVARVRYRGKALDAADVRVFFRLFTTAATGLDYAANSTYRRTTNGTPVALLGLQGGEIVTIPCYAAARVDSTSVALDTQTDTSNVRTLPHGAQEVHGYFGCWLDFNQTTPRFASHPAPANGPWPSGARSVQELIRGMHQCLVAEVHLAGDPIPEGATPAANENLAQRNLAIVESDNPGMPATHTVQHTFEIKATRPLRQDLQLALTGEVGERQGPQRALPADELMIRWNNLPRSSGLTIYMPDVDAYEVMRLRGQNYEGAMLELVDAHTIRCLTGDISFVPLPAGRSKNIAALLTVELPANVKRGQSFQVVLHQLSGWPRRVLGAFQLNIPVSDKSVLLRPEVRKLSVLRHIAQSIPLEDQWHAVFVRYLDQIAGRVRGFGGDPDAVKPAADGGDGDAGAGPQSPPCTVAPCEPAGVQCLGIPWRNCDYEGELRLRVRFRRR